MTGATDRSTPGTGTMLTGITVLELATVITGPYAGMLLADLGAEVIKVEAPTGDGFRKWDGSGAPSVQPAFATFNRGKRSIAVNLKTDEGRRIFHDLAAHADAVIENFRPSVADRLGIGYDDLRAVNSAIVFCSITGLGTVGPDRDRPTYDAVAQAMSGLWSQLSDLANPEPVGPAMADQLTGMYAALSILAAVTEARRSGTGQHIEVSMLGSCISFLGLSVATYANTREVTTKLTRARTSQSYGFVGADGLPFTVHLSTPQKFWEGLCHAAGAPELIDDPRFASKSGRIEHYDELRTELSARFATENRDVWLQRLTEHDVPAAPILDIAETIAHPQVVASGIVDQTVDARLAVAPVRSPVRVDGVHVASDVPAPELSEQADGVLKSIGRDADEIERLRSAGIVV